MNEIFPLEKAAEAYERMMSGKARFRVVLDIAGNKICGGAHSLVLVGWRARSFGSPRQSSGKWEGEE